MREPSQRVNQLATEVVDSAIEVHRYLGPGFLESVYEKALCYELTLRKVPYQAQKSINLDYKGLSVGEARLDLLVGEELIVELKAVEQLHQIYHAQVINYLKATKLELGLLINFNVKLLKDGIQRIVLTQ